MNPRYYGGLGAKVLNPGDITDTTGASNASRALAEGYGYWNEAPMLQEAAFWGNPLSATEQTLQGMQRRDLDYQRMYEETLRDQLRNALTARQIGQNRDLKQQELQQNAWAKQGDWGIASDKINKETQASQNKLQSDLTKWMFGEQKADQRAKLQNEASKYASDQRVTAAEVAAAARGDKPSKIPNEATIMSTAAALMQKNPGMPMFNARIAAMKMLMDMENGTFNWNPATPTGDKGPTPPKTFNASPDILKQMEQMKRPEFPFRTNPVNPPWQMFNMGA